MQIPLVDLKAQYQSIKAEIDAAVQDVLDSARFIGGEHVQRFQEEFARFCNSGFSVGVSSGTSALYLALKASGIKSGDEVITVPYTFIATTEAISQNNASFSFVDIDEKTFNMNPELIKITKKTKAIIPVHIYGQPADMKPIKEIAEKHNLTIIEDCAQAHGAEYLKKRVPYTSIGCFSFYPGKNLGAYGDAGAVVTNDKDFAEKISQLSDHGRELGSKYKHSTEGGNHRLDAIQAAILRVKLRHLEEWTEKRIRNAGLYNKLLKGIVETPFQANYAKHVYHLYVIKTEKRDQLQEFLKNKGISCLKHYPIPLHLQPAYGKFGYEAGDFPVAEKASKEILSLPMNPFLTEEEISYVAKAILYFFRKN